MMNSVCVCVCVLNWRALKFACFLFIFVFFFFVKFLLMNHRFSRPSMYCFSESLLNTILKRDVQ
jgi:hypothetical protein